jgi:Flp pilus assembly protein TadD
MLTKGNSGMATELLHIRRSFLIGLGLVIVTLAVYWQVLNHDFVNFDDQLYVTENRQIQAGLTWEGVIWSFTSGTFVTNYWAPLTWLSHMLDFELYGKDPGGHHWNSLLLHILNALLLFGIMKKTTGALWRSGLVAALFAVHPLHVESVAWVAERKDVLSTFFWLLGMLAYTRYARQPELSRYFQVLLFFVLGLMSKPMLVTFPFVLLLMDYWPLGRLQLGQRIAPGGIEIKESSASILVGEKLPFFALTAAASVAAFIYQKKGGALPPMDLAVLKTQIANALISYASYIGKMIWPSRLAIFYPHPGHIPIWQTLGAGTLLACLSVLFIRPGRKFPYLPVGWFWYLGTLVPVIGLVKVGHFARADRYTYVPLIGLFIMMAWGIPEFWPRWRHRKIWVAATATVLLSMLMLIAWKQVGYWQNSLALFTQALNVTSGNSVAHYSLGVALEKEKRVDEALFHYAKALQVNPNHAKAHNNMGNLLARQGDANGASKHYLAAVRINPKHAGAYYNLGQISANQGKTAEAILCYRQALLIEPNMFQALYRQAWIAATHENIKFRNGIKAVELSEKLCKLTDYNEPLALDVLAAAYAEAGRFEEAVQKAEKAHRLALISGPEELILGVKKRLQLYQAGSPYRQN